MKKSKPIIKFRIYAWKSSLYFNVYIWKYKKEMLAQWNRDDQSIGRGCAAFTHPFTIINFPSKKKDPKQRRRMLPICGEIHLCYSDLGTEVITHESSHAAMAILRRKHFWFDKISNDENDNYMQYEEELCYTVGYFARQIVDKLYKLKILLSPTKN